VQELSHRTHASRYFSVSLPRRKLVEIVKEAGVTVE